MNKDTAIWILGIVIGIDTAVIGYLLKEYLSFRFHLAEQYVLRSDYRSDIEKVFEKLDSVNATLNKLFQELSKKADRI